MLGELPDKLFIYCSDASISRYLRARNWNVKKATKMLKETLKWRFEYRPEEIRWVCNCLFVFDLLGSCAHTICFYLLKFGYLLNQYFPVDQFDDFPNENWFPCYHNMVYPIPMLIGQKVRLTVSKIDPLP